MALSQPLGERGLNTLRLLLGVIVGIVTGEVTVALLGGGYGRLALATFVAMAVAQAVRGTRMVSIQAAAGAPTDGMRDVFGDLGCSAVVTKVTVADDLVDLDEAEQAVADADVVVLMAGLVAAEGAGERDADMLHDQNRMLAELVGIGPAGTTASGGFAGGMTRLLSHRLSS